jgi:hypothetical protein
MFAKVPNTGEPVAERSEANRSFEFQSIDCTEECIQRRVFPQVR